MASLIYASNSEGMHLLEGLAEHRRNRPADPYLDENIKLTYPLNVF